MVWIRFIQRFNIFEKIRYRHLHPQVVPNDSQYVESASTKFEVMLNNCNQTIADNCSADLNSDGIFACAPIRLDMKMLFYPFEKQFHLPSLFVKHRNIGRIDMEVVGKIYECSPVLFGIIDNPSEFGRVFCCCLHTFESNRLILDDIVIIIKQFAPFQHLIAQVAFLSNDEVRSYQLEAKESFQIKIPPPCRIYSRHRARKAVRPSLSRQTSWHG